MLVTTVVGNNIYPSGNYMVANGWTIAPDTAKAECETWKIVFTLGGKVEKTSTRLSLVTFLDYSLITKITFFSKGGNTLGVRMHLNWWWSSWSLQQCIGCVSVEPKYSCDHLSVSLVVVYRPWFTVIIQQMWHICRYSYNFIAPLVKLKIFRYNFCQL